MLDVVADLDRQLSAPETSVRLPAERVELLETMPGIGELLALPIAAEIGEMSRSAHARKPTDQMKNQHSTGAFLVARSSPLVQGQSP